MILSSATEVRYAEHENLNAYRNYPFAESAELKDADGAVLATDVFVDALLYPVVQEPTRARLSAMDCTSGAVTVACESGETLSGQFSEDGDGCIELYDGLGRHAGTFVCGPGWEREVSTGRKRMFDNLWMASSACCPVVHAGVVGITDADRKWRTTRRHLVMEGDGTITPVLTPTDRGAELRFDAQYSPYVENRSRVAQIVFAAVGRTLFDIAEVDDGTVEVFTPELDREDICWQAHKEDSAAVVVDACESEDSCDTPVIPVRADTIKVCPSAIGNISIVADDAVNYRNPVKITPVEGDSVAPRPQIETGMSQDEIFTEAHKMLERPVTTGNGVRISMPGLNNGK